MASIIELVKNDTKPQLEFTCKINGDILNLTNTVVRFVFRKTNASAVKFKRTCIITDAVNGLCIYSWHSDDLDTKGDFVGELEVTFDDNTVQTSKRIYFKVREELG